MSSAPPPPPPPPGPPVMASTSKQSMPSKKATQNRSLLLSDIQKGTRLKSSKHLMKDRSGLLTATNGKSSQNNSGGVMGGGSAGGSSGGTGESVGFGKANRGPPNLGDLFAGGIPKLKSTASSRQSESSEALDGLKRKSQVVRTISQEEGQRMKPAEPPLTNNDTNHHISNMSLRRISTGTLKKPPVPGNKPALPGPKPSLSFCQRTSTSNLTATDKPVLDSQPVLFQPSKPPTPPAKPSYMQNLNKDSQTIGRKSRPVSCAPSFSGPFEATSFLNMAESPFAFPIPRPSVAEPAKTAKRPQSTIFGAQTLHHTKSDHVRMCPRPLTTPPPLPKRETNGSSMPNSSEDATDLSCQVVSPSAGTVNGSSESRSKVRKRENRSSMVEQSSLSSLISYDKDFEAQFRFHREKELPPPDTFKSSHKTYPSTNPKNPANRGSYAVW